MGWSREELKEGLFLNVPGFPRSIIKDMHFLQPGSPSETIPQKGSPTPKIALIREKTALLFWESRDSLSIRLSGAEPKLKITANSTYWEAKLRRAGGVTRSREKEHLFWGEIWKVPSSDTDVKSEVACIGGPLANNRSHRRLATNS
jgi:hypothetical protein